MEQNKLYQKIEGLTKWMFDVEFRSYDPFDLQSTRSARIAGSCAGDKFRLYVLGGLMKAGEMFPSASRIFISKTRAAHSIALSTSAFSMMYAATSKEKWKNDAIAGAYDLLTTICSGYHGACWGLPFCWQIGKGTLCADINTPYSTVTPYGTEALIKAYEIEKDPRYTRAATSTADFFMKDLKITYSDGDSIGISYSPIDDFSVINCNAYAAGNMALISPYLSEEKRNECMTFSSHLVNFVLSEQNNNGGWLYWRKAAMPTGNGEDLLHQVYILQWLLKYNMVINSTEVSSAITRGTDYVLSDYIHEKNNLGTKQPNNTSQKYHLIDNAELASLLLDTNPELGKEVMQSTLEKFTVTVEPYLSPFYNTGKLFPLPYIRWGNAQALYAMSKCYWRIVCQNC